MGLKSPGEARPAYKSLPLSACLPWGMLCPRKHQEWGLEGAGTAHKLAFFLPFCSHLGKVAFLQGRGQTFWISSTSGVARSSSILLSFMQAW